MQLIAMIILLIITFITAGNDIRVRVYDEDMKKEIAQMKPYLFDQPGHYGRIFYVK